MKRMCCQILFKKISSPYVPIKMFILNLEPFFNHIHFIAFFEMIINYNLIDHFIITYFSTIIYLLSERKNLKQTKTLLKIALNFF